MITSAGPCEEIKTGLLPLKLNTGADKREIERAKLLVTSLTHFWRGHDPFLLYIVGRDDEVDQIREFMSPLNNQVVRNLVVSESDMIDEISDLELMKGMYRQQVIKLFAPITLGLSGFITFDADIVCTREFDEGTFIRHGKIASNWESRRFHSWWENAMAGIRAWSDSDVPGLGVTPNTLHAAICRDVLHYLKLRNPNPLRYLHDLSENHPKLTSYDDEGISLAWSEYSLYTIIGEWFSHLFDYHMSPQEVSQAGIQLHSRRNVWFKGDLHRLVPDPGDPGYFLVVQSWAGISVEEIRSRIGLPL